MAPLPCKPSYLELYKSDITTPEPLKIIKARQTVTNCSAPSKENRGGSRFSNSSSQGEWSPPMRPNWPVTVKKRDSGTQRGRSSSYESISSIDSNMASMSLGDLMRAQRAELNLRKDRLYDIPFVEPPEDLEATPKAFSPVLRSSSASAFLKLKLHQQSSQNDASRLFTRRKRHSVQQESFSDSQKASDQRAVEGSNCEIRVTKSRKSPFRSQEGHGQHGYKTARFINSNFHNNCKILLAKHHPYRRKSILTSSEPSPYLWRSDLEATRNIYSSNESNLGETYLGRRTSSSIKRLISRSLSSAFTTPAFQSTDNYILFPEIRITPETRNIDIAESILWVAVEIKGTLRKTEVFETKLYGLEQDRASAVFKTRDVGNYGYLDSMHIHFKAGRGCLISEIIGDNREPLIIGVNESHLVLVKVRFEAVRTSMYYQEASPDGLMRALKNDLGNIQSEYLTVQVSFKNSWINGAKFPTTCTPGVSPQKTQIQTEATATVWRYDSKSAWSPHKPQIFDIPLSGNPVLCLVKSKLPLWKAQEAIRIIAASKQHTFPAKRLIQAEKPGRLVIKSAATAKSTFNLDEFPLPPLNNMEPDEAPKPDSDFEPTHRTWGQLDSNSPLTQTHNLCRVNFSRKVDENDPRLSSRATSVNSFHSGLHSFADQQIRDDIMNNTEESIKSKDTATSLEKVFNADEDSNPKSTDTMRNQLGLGIERNWLLGLFSGS